MLDTKSFSKEENLHIKFNSHYNKFNNYDKNNNKNGSYNYTENLLNKKRKLENDIKKGNVTNFNKILSNAVTSSTRNNENELIPYKIEFKLSHVLKGEKKISENNNNNYNNNTNDNDNFSELTKTSSIENEKKNLLKEKEKEKVNNNNKDYSEKNNISLNKNDDILKISNNLIVNNNISNNPAVNLIDNEIKLSRKNSMVSYTSEKSSKSKEIFNDNFVDGLLEWKKPTAIGSGLNNMGNTCFLNSVLQSLLYTPGLINYFDNSEIKRKYNPRGICFLIEFNNLIDASKKSKIHSLTPKGILNNLKVISKNLKIGRQEDAHEFLLYLLDALEKSCKIYTDTIKSNFIINSNGNEDNLIQKLFGGKLASCVICLKCKNVSKKIDQYLDISLVN
jgi:ubiquitin carboxyl-terminal hydrolase 36/42